MSPPNMEQVYQSTILPLRKKSDSSIKGWFGKIFSFTKSETTDPLLPSTNSDMAKIVGRRASLSAKPGDYKVPTFQSRVAEEMALLSMPADDEMELRHIHQQFPSAGRLANDGSYEEVWVVTDHGELLVAVKGDPNKPAILTYHDVGLNHVSNFQGFFSYGDMSVIADNFCVYHVNAPGQEEGAKNLPLDYVYPSMAELSRQIHFVMVHFGIKSFIGFAQGLGAHVLSKFAYDNPDKVDGLVVINCTSTQSGWLEWGYQKYNSRNMRNRGMTDGALNYLMWHHFGRNWESNPCPSMIQSYRAYFATQMNPANLAGLASTYVGRSDLGISREKTTIQASVLNVTGTNCPYLNDTVILNSRLSPVNSAWLKLEGCSMVLEEQPLKVIEAFNLFLQGLGYMDLLSKHRRQAYRVKVMREQDQARRNTMRITANPISDTLLC